MPPHITVVPASTKAGLETIRQLLASDQKPHIRAIYRDPSKAPTDFTQHTNFEATKGDVGTGTGLDFSGCDTVFYIPPPTFDGQDQGEWATRTATNVKKAVRDAGSVKRLLVFSALGAQHDHGTGIIRLNHITDKILQDAAPEVIIVRPAHFHTEWASSVEQVIKTDLPVLRSWVTPADHKIPMVSVPDIAKTCAATLLAPEPKPHSPYVFKLLGPRHYSSNDLRDAMEQATGKPVRLKLVERDELPAFFGEVVPPAYVGEFAELVTALLPGGIANGDFGYDEGTVRGEVELVESLSEMVAAVTGRE